MRGLLHTQNHEVCDVSHKGMTHTQRSATPAVIAAIAVKHDVVPPVPIYINKEGV